MFLILGDRHIIKPWRLQGVAENHAEGVYIINGLPLYLIDAKHRISSSRRKDARWRVMIYSPTRADEILVFARYARKNG